MANLTIKKWGNSQGIRIPKKMLRQIGIDDPINQTININVKDDELVIKKKPSKSKLAQRFEGFDLDKYYAENSDSQEMDWGEPVGKEKLD